LDNVLIIFCLRNNYNIIIPENLDTLIPTWAIAKLKRGKIVYDIADFYSDAFIPVRMRIIRRIVAKGSSMSRIVSKENCGLVIDYYNIQDLQGAILMLKNDPKLATELGKNARKTYTTYNWSIVENRLSNRYTGIS
jgi:hypothetical protein